jgi:hypothetical protein
MPLSVSTVWILSGTALDQVVEESPGGGNVFFCISRAKAYLEVRSTATKR